MQELTTKEFASLVGVSEQTIRNLDDVLPPNNHTVNGHRRYSYNQIFDYFRLANENAVLKNNVKRLVVFLHRDISGLFLYYYIKYKFKDYEVDVVNIDELTSEDCINKIASLGVFDSIYYLQECDNILSSYPIVLKRLGIKQVCIERSYGNEFKIFVRLLSCLFVYDLFLSQVDCYKNILDVSVVNYIVSSVRSCVKYLLDNSIVKNLNLDFINIKVRGRDLIDNYKNLSVNCSDFEFVFDMNGFIGFYLRKGLRSSMLIDFLKLYNSCKRRDLDLYELLGSSCHSNMLKVKCIGG